MPAENVVHALMSTAEARPEKSRKKAEKKMVVAAGFAKMGGFWVFFETGVFRSMFKPLFGAEAGSWLLCASAQNLRLQSKYFYFKTALIKNSGLL